MARDSSMAIGSLIAIPAAVRVLAGTIAIGLPMFAQAQSPVDPAAVEANHPTGHVHDRADLTWPPQPRGIANARLLNNAGAETVATEARERFAADRERTAMARAGVRKALGARFTRAAVADDEDKSGAAPTTRLVYFSHSNNFTVEVTFDRKRVRQVKRIPPSEYQPEITDEETAEAEVLARAYFSQLGVERVSALEAFGILAYKPSGNGFFGTRVLYVSFHRDSDAPPEYVAWVDLTRQRVLRAQEEPQ